VCQPYHMQESKILNKLLLSFNKFTSPKSRIFRNNTGSAFQGKKSLMESTRERLVLFFPRIVHFGLCKGSSDAIGWTTIKIGPEMVGEEVAVFTALETKTKKGRVSEEQAKFLDTVSKAGGISGVVRSLDDFKDLVKSTTLMK